MGGRKRSLLKPIYKFFSCLSKCLRKERNIENSDDKSSKKEEIYSEFEKKVRCEKYALILEEARTQFDRLNLNINSINSKIIASFQIFLVVITIQVTVFLYYFKFEETPHISLSIFIILLTISLTSFIYHVHLLWPKTYEYPFLFENEQLRALFESDSHRISSDLLYHIIISYDHNREVYSKLTKGLKINLLFLMANLFLFIILVFSSPTFY